MRDEVHIDWLGRRLAQLPARRKRRVGWTAVGRPWRVVVSGAGGRRAVADVRGYRAARQLRDGWRQELAGGTPAAALHVPSGIPGTLRHDLIDPEGFGEVRPDELAG